MRSAAATYSCRFFILHPFYSRSARTVEDNGPDQDVQSSTSNFQRSTSHHAAGLADRCEVQIAYAIGYSKPVSVLVNTFKTGKIDDRKIEEIVKKTFDLSPAGIVKMLDLKKPGYLATAALGHFGRTGTRFTWEKTDKAAILKKLAKV